MEDETNKPKKGPVERRSGEDRRKFSFGYQGHDRRKSFGRRKNDQPPQQNQS